MKYSLTPGQIRNTLAHLGQIRLRRRYHTQSAQQGQTCIIVITPERHELVQDS